jgi:8-oxo-dGTP diphosphatase
MWLFGKKVNYKATEYFRCGTTSFFVSQNDRILLANLPSHPTSRFLTHLIDTPFQLSYPGGHTPRVDPGGLMRLETQRLILRPLTPSDVAAIFHLYADWEVAKNLSRIVFPFSYQAAQQFIATAQADLAQASGYTLGMFQRESATFIGVISLRIPSNTPPLSAEARAPVAGLGILGYAVARPYWHQGYASESATRMVAFAFDELRLTRLQASPLQGNRASQRILERLNFRVTEAGVAEEPLYGGPARLVDRYTLVRSNATA